MKYRPMLFACVCLLSVSAFAEDTVWLPADYALRNLAQHVFPGLPRTDLPLKVAPFVEHVRAEDLLFTAEEAKRATGITLPTNCVRTRKPFTNCSVRGS